MLQYNFRVNTLDYLEVFSSSQPDSNINNIVYQLENATVWIAGVDRPLKHGDVFSLTGPLAAYAYTHHVEKFPFILETYEIPRVTGLELFADGDQGVLTWNADNTFYTSVEVRIAKGQWKKYKKEIGVENMSIVGEPGELFEVRLRFTDGTNYSQYYTTASVTLPPIMGYIFSEDLEYALVSEDGNFYLCEEGL